jgi:hypothetical protein
MKKLDPTMAQQRSDGTTSSVYTVLWGSFGRWSTTEANRRSFTPSGGRSWLPPGIDGEKRIYDFGSPRCH